MGHTDFAPRLIHQPHSDVVRENEPFTCECPVESRPASEFLWYKDNKLLVSEPAHLEQTSNELMFIQINENDTGDYHCEASNSLGKVVSQPFRLTVKTSKYILAATANDTNTSSLVAPIGQPPALPPLLTQYLTIYIQLLACLMQLALLCLAYYHDPCHLNLPLETFLF